MTEPAGGAVYETEVALRWGDMDSQGHVNNAVTVTLLEEGRVRFLLHAAGGSPDRPAGDFGLVAARHEIDYVRPLFYSQEPLRLRLWIDRIGTASFTFGCEVRDPSGGVAVRARTVVVAVRPDGSGSRPIPDQARRILARYLPAGNAS